MSENVTAETLALFRERPSIAVLMSGAGTNAAAILENRAVRKLYDIRAIVTDNPSSRAQSLATEFGLTLIEAPQGVFRSVEERQDYFDDLAELLEEQAINATIYAGFMKISTERFNRRLPGINVHPADLTILSEDGIATYRGMDALEAMASDLGYVKATVHVVDTPVDSGAALAVSAPVEVLPGETVSKLHGRLKELEHLIFPETLVRMGRGDISEANLPLDLSSLKSRAT
jgi:folate-dependent phosphoribosylglycinamide formyltransferase PurN